MKNLLKKAVIFAVAGIMALSVEAQEEKGVQFTVSGDFVSAVTSTVCKRILNFNFR